MESSSSGNQCRVLVAALIGISATKLWCQAPILGIASLGRPDALTLLLRRAGTRWARAGLVGTRTPGRSFNYKYDGRRG